MLANFLPPSLSFRAAINSTGPVEDLDLANPIIFPASFPQDVHFDPAPQTTLVSAAVEPATGPFRVRDLIIFDVGLVTIHDPDVGRPVRVKALTFAGSHDGSGSIQIAAGQVLLARVAYDAGAVPATQTGQLIITAADSNAAKIPLSLTTFVPNQSVVQTAVSNTAFSITAGKTASLGITVRWVSGPAADVRFEKAAIFLDAQVSMQPTAVHVEPGETRNATLLFRAEPDAKLGTFDLAVQQFAPNRLPFLDLRVTIMAAPTVSATCLTHHYDNQRTGTNLMETTLTTSNVNAQRFGKLFEREVDGQIYGQPLYVPDVLVAGQRRNVLYVATMRNNVYAFDADEASASAPLWHVSLGPFVKLPDENIGGPDYHDIADAVGVVSTPVISLRDNAIYVLALTKEGSTYTHRLHALDIRDGRELFNGPRIVAASVRGSGAGSDQGVISFTSSLQNQRPGLLLSNECVFAAFASYGDHGPYHGWVFGFKADTLDPLPNAFNTTPDGAAGGIWQAGQGPAADAEGNIYFMTGNGTFSNGARPMLGDSAVKLRPDLSLGDWFSPFNTDALNGADNDLGSGGLLLIPNTNLLVGGGKEGKLYVLDKGNLGHFNAAGDTQIVQSWQAAGLPKNGVAPPAPPQGLHHIHGSPIIWDAPNRGATIYVWAEADWMRAFTFRSGRFDTAPADMTTMTTPALSMPGAMLSLSADGSRSGTGIIWALHPIHDDANKGVVDGLVRAIDASNLQNELWNSEQRPTRDRLGKLAKFTPPTVVNGKVYVATFSNKVWLTD